MNYESESEKLDFPFTVLKAKLKAKSKHRSRITSCQVKKHVYKYNSKGKRVKNSSHCLYK